MLFSIKRGVQFQLSTLISFSCTVSPQLMNFPHITTTYKIQFKNSENTPLKKDLLNFYAKSL